MPYAEVLRRVLDESDDAFSSSDEEIVGDVNIDGQHLVWIRPSLRCGPNLNVEPCLLDSALLYDDEVGEVSDAIFLISVLFCVKFLANINFSIGVRKLTGI